MMTSFHRSESIYRGITRHHRQVNRFGKCESSEPATLEKPDLPAFAIVGRGCLKWQTQRIQQLIPFAFVTVCRRSLPFATSYYRNNVATTTNAKMRNKRRAGPSYSIELVDYLETRDLGESIVPLPHPRIFIEMRIIHETKSLKEDGDLSAFRLSVK
jgi:hypothetical protein